VTLQRYLHPLPVVAFEFKKFPAMIFVADVVEGVDEGDRLLAGEWEAVFLHEGRRDHCGGIVEQQAGGEAQREAPAVGFFDNYTHRSFYEYAHDVAVCGLNFKQVADQTFLDQFHYF